MKEETLLHPEKPPTPGRSAGTGEPGRRTRQQSRWRRHRRSAGWGLAQWVLLGLGAGTWASEIRTGERSGDGRVGTDSGGRESCATAAGSVPSGSLGHPGDQRPQWGACGERQDPDCSVLPCAQSQRAGRCLHGRQGLVTGQKLPP